jgi:hypothetical protein
MDQRLSPCAHWAPRLPVPSTTTSIAQGSLYTAPWPHHPDRAYRPFLSGTAGMAMSNHGQTGSAGYSCSPYSVPPTFSQLGITSLGHVTRWWVREVMGSTHFGLICRTLRTPGLDLRHVDLIVRHKMIGFRCHSRGRGRCWLRG